MNHPNRGAGLFDKKAFVRFSAFVIVKDGERVAEILFRFPADGVGRLHAHVRLHDYPMVCGSAGGYCHDKRSAAVSVAAMKLRGQAGVAGALGAMFAEPGGDADKFMAALALDDGMGWDRRLRDAGFDVMQAV